MRSIIGYDIFISQAFAPFARLMVSRVRIDTVNVKLPTSIVVSFLDTPFPQRWMYYITSTRKEGLENIARFSCATGMQSNAKSHEYATTRNSD